eukprot:6614449-Pyramimonas_sp.AAC.1
MGPRPPTGTSETPQKEPPRGLQDASNKLHRGPEKDPQGAPQEFPRGHPKASGPRSRHGGRIGRRC